jgi:hypothetical protein
MSALFPSTLPSEIKVTDFKFERYAKFKPHSVIVQKRWTTNVERTQSNSNSLMNLEKGAAGQYNGYLSPGTRRKVKGIIENYLTAVQFSTSMVFPKSFPSKEVYPTFMTLTLPGKQYHCDNDVKDIFSRFMEYLTGSKERGNSGWNVRNYIWVAETQKNGNIHFHVILDRAIPGKRINEEWNRMIERLGYVTRFRNRQEYIYSMGFYVRKNMMAAAIERDKKTARQKSAKFDLQESRKKEAKRQKEAYEKGRNGNWNNPPTTQIHAIHNIKKLTAYVAKYMTKEPEIVNVPLQPGESLIQENGHYFIQTEKIEKRETIEGIEVETVSTDRRPIKVSFQTRHLRGRIWGASKKLHTADLSPLTIALESWSRVTTTSYEHRPVKIQQPVYTVNIFGENVFSHMQETIQVNTITSQNSNYDPPVVDYDANRWVQFLSEEHVSQAEIDRATAKAGEHFSHYGGIIIPLDFPQKDLLKAYSPNMYVRYEQHYKDMFNTLYMEDNV